MNARHFRTFARYNAWANARLYAACGALSEAAYLAERPVFFGSIHRTLNHVLVGDRLWLGRITGVPAGIPTLDTELFPDRDALRAAREAEDARIIGLVDGYDDARLLAAEVAHLKTEVITQLCRWSRCRDDRDLLMALRTVDELVAIEDDRA